MFAHVIGCCMLAVVGIALWASREGAGNGLNQPGSIIIGAFIIAAGILIAN